MPDRPPGPSNRLWSTIQVVARPMTSMTGWFARYGDPIHVPTINGNVVMTAQPALVKQIFSAPGTTYSPFAPEGIEALTGPRSLFQLRGAEHRRHRRLIMPAFHRARMRAYAADIQQATREIFDQAVGQGPRVLHQLTQRISLEVILRAVFGVQAPAQVEAFTRAITELVDRTSPVFVFAPFLQRELWGLSPYARFRRAFERFDALIAQQVVLTRRRDDDGHDMLSMLLAARDEEGHGLDDLDVRDELRTLLFAGHETTGIALSWAVDLVGRHPAVARRLVDELSALGPDAPPESFTQAPYLEAVCNETLRLYPIVTEVLRTLHEPLELGGYALRPPTAVSPSILGVHRRPELYPEPERFRPERFIERTFGPHEFLPFGGGHRRCVGAAFASFEMRVVLGTVLREYAIHLCSPVAPPPVRRNITIAPRGGVPVVITRAAPGSVSAAAA